MFLQKRLKCSKTNKTPDYLQLLRLDAIQKDSLTFPTRIDCIIEIMIVLKRTTAENKDFVNLVSELDAELAIRDGDDHDFYHQFNGLEDIKHAVLLYSNKEAVGCGAIKKYDDSSMEVKRMYVKTDFRGKGLAVTILDELEAWSKELNYTFCILETGVNQPEAIKLYKKTGYHVVENYGQYAGVSTSFCFKKRI